MASIIVSWRDRDELPQTLPGLVRTARALGGDLTIVNYGGSRSRLARDLAAHAGSLRVVDVDGEQWFNKSRAQNLGAANTDGEILFFCDCDIVLEPQSVATLVRRLLAGTGTFATLAGVTESERNSRGGRHVVRFGYELDIRTADGRSVRIVDHEEDCEEGTRQAPGLLLVRRRDFIRVDGYNSRLLGWGWEDQDMICRLTLGADLDRLQGGAAIHISHDDGVRLHAYPPVRDRWENRDHMFRAALANYDRADFAGTYSADIEAVNARTLDGRQFVSRYGVGHVSMGDGDSAGRRVPADATPAESG